MIKLRLNPVKLIRWLDAQNLFQSRVPEGTLNVIEISENEVSVAESSMPQMSSELILPLLHFCFNYESLRKPLLLMGTDEKCLDVLNWLYFALPFRLRGSITFDTYCYGANLDFNITGIPDAPEFHQSVLNSLKLNTTTMQIASSIEIKEPSQDILFISKMASASRLDELDSMSNTEYILKKGDYEGFKRCYLGLSTETKDYLFTSERHTILDFIRSKKDWNFLKEVADKLKVHDISRLSAEHGLISNLAAVENDKILNVIADWLYSLEDKQLFYPILMSSRGLWRPFLKKLPQEENMELVVEGLNALVINYSSGLEDIFLDEILSKTETYKNDKKTAKAFIAALEKLPPAESEGSTLLRTYLKYELTGKTALLRSLVESNMSILSKGQQDILLGSIMKRVAETSDLGEMLRLFKILFDKVENKQEYMARLVTLLGEQDLPNKNRKILREELSGWIEIIPQDDTALKLKETLENVLAEKSSFFKAFKSNLGRFKQNKEDKNERGKT